MVVNRSLLRLKARRLEQRGDDRCSDFRVVGDGVEQRTDQFFEDAAQATGAGLVLDRDLSNLQRDSL